MIEIIFNGYTIRFKCTGEHSNALKDGKIVLKEEKTFIPEGDNKKEKIDGTKKEFGFRCEEKNIIIRCVKACKWQQYTEFGIPTDKWVNPEDGQTYNMFTLPNDPNFWLPQLMNNLPNKYAVHQYIRPSTNELLWCVAHVSFGAHPSTTRVLDPSISSSPSLLHALLNAIEKISNEE